MRVTLGINNCFAVKRWPRPDEWAEIVEQLGLEVVQHSLDLSDLNADLEADAQAVNDACGRHHLRIDSVFTGLVAYSANLMLGPQLHERDRGERYWSDAILFASRLCASSCGGHVGSLSRLDADDPARQGARWAELKQRLTRLSFFARQSGLDSVLVENMACDREPCLMADIRSLLRSSDSDHAAITLCLDVGHQCVPGTSGDEADPYAWLATLGREATVVHLQQSDAHADHHWPFTTEYNERGRIRAPLVLDALSSSRTEDAMLVLEVIPAFEAADARVLDDLLESVNYWKEAVDKFEQA